MEDKPKSFFSIKQGLRFFRTVRYLKFQQVFYRLFYPIKKLYYVSVQIPERPLKAAMQHLDRQFAGSPGTQNIHYSENNTFTFLNKSKSFGPGIDWQFREFGLLWSFHLHYFDWLFAPGVSFEKGLSEIRKYIDNHSKGYFFNHSYIASYRIVNWIRFCAHYRCRDEQILASLYKQSHRLAAFPEYELMGNHLMENGIALAWAGLFFDDTYLLGKGERILRQQFREQILRDGVHFEKSYSYHTVLLKRLLELAQVYRYLSNDSNFYKELKIICSEMLSHVFVLTNMNDFPPLFGDGNEESHISVQNLTNLAQNLHVKDRGLSLGESGLRKLVGEDCTVFFNLGNIPASYQPGHAHADALAFCLNVRGKPLLVDRGVSTYEAGVARQRERSTAAHNTVFLAGADSSEVWASFRMGKRAECVYLDDTDYFIDCEHNGYLYDFGIIHRRSIRVSGKSIVIEDSLQGWNGQEAGIAFHFYPGLEPLWNNEAWELPGVRIEVEGAATCLEDYEYAKGFNKTLPARRIVGSIRKEIVRTSIVLR